LSLDIVSRQRRLSLDGRPDDALLLLLSLLLLLLLQLFVLDEVVIALRRRRLLDVRRPENRNDRRFEVLPIFGAAVEVIKPYFLSPLAGILSKAQ